MSPSPCRSGPETLALITSELSPAVVVTCNAGALTLFGELDRWGVGGASHIASVETSGVQVRARRPGETLVLPTSGLSEAWTLLWFAGAAGWEWDAPWLVVWQRRPKTLVLSDAGLHATAAGALGDVALMPLYGLFKPKTESWHKGLPSEVVTRCRFWSRVLRRYPIACDETFRLDPDSNAILIRNAFTYREIDDDWKTPPLLFAPLSPTLALAYQSKRLPMRVSANIHDPDVCTGFGPYLGVQNARQYELSFPLLHYVTETEQEAKPNLANPIVRQAHERLEQTLESVFSAPDGLFHPDFGDPAGLRGTGDDGNTCWAMVSHQYYCRALPYVSSALQAKIKQRLRPYLADWVLQEKRFKPFKGKLLFVGPGIGTWGGYDDAGKFSSNALITLWAYARYTGDWELIRERWELIQRLFITPRECSWRGFGRSFIAELGDEAGPALAMARLAWGIGDKQAFAYAAYIFVRELVHHTVKVTGASYFVAKQPLHQPKPITGPVYLTNLLGGTFGWDMDGPQWKTHEVDTQYVNRWVRFGDPDVARFHRECLPEETRRERELLLSQPEVPPRAPNTLDDPHIRPSRLRLCSLLGSETPETLASIAPVTAPLSPGSAVAAYCLAFLRASTAPRSAALIPKDQTATEWAKGIERDCPQGEPVLCIGLKSVPGEAPSLVWNGWRPPKGGEEWSFGCISTVKVPAITSQQPQSLSWNSVMHVIMR